MAEDEYRRRTNLHAGRQTLAYQKKPAQFHLLRFQLIVCALCILVVSVIRLIGGGVYTTVKAKVTNALNSPVTYSQVQGVMATIKNGLPSVSGIFATSGSSSGAGSASPSSSGNAASSSASGASSNASSQTSSAASSAASSSASK